MNEVRIFSSPEFGDIRTAGTPEEPLFCLSDICKALELTNPAMVKSRLNERGINTIYPPTAGGAQSMTYFD